MRLTKTLKNAIHAHAKDDYPNECCGLIMGDEYVRLDNMASDKADHFEIGCKSRPILTTHSNQNT